MPVDVYEQFRLSLIKRRPEDLFTQFEETREQYLRRKFGKSLEFDHYGSAFTYKNIQIDHLGPFIIGKVGRIVRTIENAPPEQGFDEKTHDGWRAAVIVVDPRDSKDGQKISIQNEKLIGKPFSIIKSICREFNSDRAAPYKIEVEPIFNANNFWDFAKENKGDITSLTFEFIVPNGWWTTASDLKEELRAAHAEVNAETVVTTFKSAGGIDTDNAIVEQSVAYAEAGSGKINATTRTGKKFSSTTKARKSIIQVNPFDTTRDAIARAAFNLAKILGHE